MNKLYGSLLVGFAFLMVGCQIDNASTSTIDAENVTPTTTQTVSGKTLSVDEARAKAEAFINGYLVEGSTATINSITDTGSLYKIDIALNGQNIISYISKDGTEFFPQSLNIEDTMAQKKAADEAAALAKEAELKDLVKNDRPVVELFVMSHCPFGTQMQKGILPVIKTLGDTIDFQVKFNTYAMHDMKEVQEQLNQYCIMTQEPEKYLGYLECFLEADDGAGCLDRLAIDKAQLDTCLVDTEEEYNVLADYEDKTTWNGQFPSFNIWKADNEKYGVQGSPTLVINGKLMQTSRDSASLLQAVCAGFENAPEECNTELSNAQPSPGFGFGTTTSATSAAACGI